jgi:hypothetical protein
MKPIVRGFYFTPRCVDLLVGGVPSIPSQPSRFGLSAPGSRQPETSVHLPLTAFDADPEQRALWSRRIDLLTRERCAVHSIANEIG